MILISVKIGGLSTVIMICVVDSTANQVAAQLLRLDNRFALQSFVNDRFDAMIAVCVAAPTPVAT
jgi:hypothetical protein